MINLFCIDVFEYNILSQNIFGNSKYSMRTHTCIFCYHNWEACFPGKFVYYEISKYIHVFLIIKLMPVLLEIYSYKYSHRFFPPGLFILKGESVLGK